MKPLVVNAEAEDSSWGLIPGTAHLDGCRPLLKLSPKLPSTLRETSSLLICRALGGTLGKGCWDRQGMPSL